MKALPWHQQYQQKRKEFAGRSFASALEADLYGYLLMLERQGELCDLRCQPHVFLTEARVEMIPDFVAYDVALSEEVYFEAKGFETDVYRIKRRLWMVYGPGRLRVFKGRVGKLKLTEEIIPQPAKLTAGE